MLIDEGYNLNIRIFETSQVILMSSMCGAGVRLGLVPSVIVAARVSGGQGTAVAVCL